MDKIYLDKLRENNFKLTPRRIAIIDFFLSMERYLNPEVVWNGLRKKFKHLGLPSSYRNLELFSKCGILTEIRMPDRRLYYGLCKAKDNKHHHHTICVKCGKVGEFSDENLFEKKTINGFKILNHFLQIEGICSDCGKLN